MVAQTYPNIALSVVDDGSTDDSADIVKGMMTEIQTEKLEDDEVFTIGKIGSIPVVLISHQKREGAPVSKNKGIISLWQSIKFIVVLHADDTMYPDKISRCVSVLESDDRIGIVYHDSIVSNPDSRYRLFRKAYDREKLEETSIVPNDAVMPKSVIEMSGMYESKLSMYESWDLWLRVTEKCAAAHIPEVLGESNTDINSRMPSQIDKKRIEERTLARRNNA